MSSLVEDEIREQMENAAFMKAISEPDISVAVLENLPPYASNEVKEVELQLKQHNLLDFNTIFHEPVGFHLFKSYLISTHAGDKAVYFKDVERYKKMGWDSARHPVARLLFERFIAEEDESRFPKGSSVFDIIKEERKKMMNMENDGGNGERERKQASSPHDRHHQRSPSAGDGAEHTPTPKRPERPFVDDDKNDGNLNACMNE